MRARKLSCRDNPTGDAVCRRGRATRNRELRASPARCRARRRRRRNTSTRCFMSPAHGLPIWSASAVKLSQVAPSRFEANSLSRPGGIGTHKSPRQMPSGLSSHPASFFSSAASSHNAFESAIARSNLQRLVVVNDRSGGRLRFSCHRIVLPVHPLSVAARFLPSRFLESDRDAQPLEMLIDYLAAQTHAMLGEELLHLVLAIEQRDDRLAHSRQRVVGIFLSHLVPMRARKVPRLVAACGVEQQRMHQVRRVLRPHLAVERHRPWFFAAVRDRGNSPAQTDSAALPAACAAL